MSKPQVSFWVPGLRCVHSADDFLYKNRLLEFDDVVCLPCYVFANVVLHVAFLCEVESGVLYLLHDSVDLVPVAGPVQCVCCLTFVEHALIHFGLLEPHLLNQPFDKVLVPGPSGSILLPVDVSLDL